MKVIAISDIHGLLLDPKKFSKGDVLCIAGDISPLEAQRNMPRMISWLKKRFVKWAEKLPVDKIFLVAGNHDFVFENKEYKKDAVAALETISNKIIYLEDMCYEYNGKVFYGSPWVSGPVNWAFYDPYMENTKKTMPNNIDVAIFHQPLEYGGNGRVLQIPSWMIGSTFSTETLTEEFIHPSYGSKILDKIVEENKPKLVLTGHVHSGNHELVSFGDSMIANVSILDEDYKQKYQPFEITL